MPRFVFFGTGEFAAGILSELSRRGLKPEYLITRPDAPAGRNLKLTPPPAKVWALENSVSVVQPESLRTFEYSDPKPEVAIISDFGRIIPDQLLAAPTLGSILTHQSLLPKYRGTSPIQYAILNGDSETGVTILMPDSEVDHGPIVVQEKIKLSGTENAAELAETLSKLGGKMLAAILPNLASARASAVVQDHSQATFSQKIIKEDGFISPTIVLGGGNRDEALSAERKVRAYNPSPICYTVLTAKNGREIRVQILRAKLETDKFIPVMVKPEGKKEMSWQDFKNGNL